MVARAAEGEAEASTTAMKLFFFLFFGAGIWVFKVEVW